MTDPPCRCLSLKDARHEKHAEENGFEASLRMLLPVPSLYIESLPVRGEHSGQPAHRHRPYLLHSAEPVMNARVCATVPRQCHVLWPGVEEARRYRGQQR